MESLGWLRRRQRTPSLIHYKIMNVVFVIIFFAAVTFSHAGFLIFAKKFQASSESFRSKLWKLHLTFNGVLWFAFVGLITAVQFSFAHSAYPAVIKIFGVAFTFFGAMLVAKSHFLLGINRAMGLRFFFPEKTKQIKSGAYRFLNNPMYDGFMLMLLGLALWLGIREDLYLALASFFLLNIFLASIENYKFKLNPF